MSHFIKKLAAVSLLAVLVSCGNDQKKVRNLTVSIPPEETLVKQIAGDRFDIECLMSSDSNPEAFEPSMGALVSLEKSDVYFTIGTLDFERNLLNHLKTSGSDVRIADLSDGVDLLYGTHGEHDHGHHHDHGSADPHTWSSVKNIMKMARTVEKTLSEIDPEGADIYKSNLNLLEHRLDSLDKSFSEKLDTVGVRTFIVWHPSLSYFARDYRLNQLTIGSHGKEQSVKQLHEKFQDAETENAEVFFIQQEFDSRQADAVNERLKVKTVPINLMNADYENELIKIADAFGSK